MMFSGYIAWHYSVGIRGLFEIVGNFWAFAFHLFSIKSLTTSYFAPWKRITDDTSTQGLLTWDFAWAVWDNVLSRILGAIARTLLLLIGFSFVAIVAVLSVVSIVFWILGPLLPPTLFALGVFLLI